MIYYNLDEKAGSAYVGIDVPEEETWGKRCGTEALSLLTIHLFQALRLNEIRTRTWTFNSRMQRVAEKCGFREIARLPNRVLVSIRGEPLEFVEFAISRLE